MSLDSASGQRRLVQAPSPSPSPATLLRKSSRAGKVRTWPANSSCKAPARSTAEQSHWSWSRGTAALCHQQRSAKFPGSIALITPGKCLDGTPKHGIVVSTRKRAAQRCGFSAIATSSLSTATWPSAAQPAVRRESGAQTVPTRPLPRPSHMEGAGPSVGAPASGQSERTGAFNGAARLSALLGSCCAERRGSSVKPGGPRSHASRHSSRSGAVMPDSLPSPSTPESCHWRAAVGTFSATTKGCAGTTAPAKRTVSTTTRPTTALPDHGPRGTDTRGRISAVATFCAVVEASGW
mmetsp:Transcript_38840/g.82597  ORF Transcript_38840/g.82597 Transcript_38840/m.82597 type:complete len:294 (+) Transcript_38840:60-941(+)